MQLKIKILAQGEPIFTSNIQTRVNDLNYGNHVGHQKVYEFCHDVRLEFLATISKELGELNEHYDQKFNDLSETQFGDIGLIMSQSAASYHEEIYYPQNLKINLYLNELKKHSFQLIYEIYDHNSNKLLSKVLTTMVCFDYGNKKITEMDNEIFNFLSKKTGQ